MSESSYLSGKVRKRDLPVFQGPPAPGTSLKRLLLPQGELAQFHDGDPPVQYLAFIELRQGTVRGNHYHRVKEEFIYVLAGELELIIEDVSSKQRETLPMQTGDWVVVAPGVAHTLRVLKTGQAIEFSQARFDATDIHRYPLASAEGAGPAAPAQAPGAVPRA
jgi:quercetin dioxygenase-like cupin family protein